VISVVKIHILMNSCRHFLVSGQVQGVFFRASTESVARRLGLTGWVRNLRDGRVELVACGEQAPLEELERWLWQGPPRAHVTQVEAKETVAQSFDGFFVRG
jgi:acylphosphatase